MSLIRNQNVTISLSVQTIQKARVLAAKRSTSISGLLREQVEMLVREDEARERASALAISRMERGLHLGGGRMVSRDELHER